MTHARHRLNVAGPFYVEDGCCTRCGVPDVTAPELFGEADYTCFVKRQPETTHELGRMLRAMITSEVGCIRYGGVDAAVIRRLAQNGESALADVAPPAGIAPVNRDHVGLRTQAPLTAQLLAESFVSHLGTQPVPFHAARVGGQARWLDDDERLIFARHTIALGADNALTALLGRLKQASAILDAGTVASTSARRRAPRRIALPCRGLTACTNLVCFWCDPVSASSRTLRRPNGSLPSGSARSYRCGRRSLRS